MALGRKARFVVPPEVRVAIRWQQRWTVRLLRKYSGRWVAISGRRVVAAESTHDKLSLALDRLGRPAVYILKIEAPGVVVY